MSDPAPCPRCGGTLSEGGDCPGCAAKRSGTAVLGREPGAGAEAMVAEPASEVLGATPLPDDLSVVLEVIEGPDRGRTFRLESSATTIGRDEGAVRLTDPGVSGRHAILEVYGAAFVVLKDLSSTNGTLVNGRLIAFGRLSDGDEIRVGGTRLLVSIDRRG